MSEQYTPPKPAIPIEDMTQPMGPLEQGDQALVDAAQKIPEGRHEVRQDGSVTWVGKTESLGQDIATVHTVEPNGQIKEASTLINKIPSVEGINAYIGERPGGQHSAWVDTHVSGNEVETGPLMFDTTHDRAKAQAVKLEVAEKIEAATQRLKDGQIQDPALAREMADAEIPHRNEIAERNKSVATANGSADFVAKKYAEGRSDVGLEELHRNQDQVTMMRDITASTNRRSLDDANTAADAARRQYNRRLMSGRLH